MQSRVLTNRFGRKYRLFNANAVPVTGSVEAESYNDIIAAKRFVRGLSLSRAFIREIASRHGKNTPSNDNTFDPELELGRLLIQGKVKVYEVKPVDRNADSARAPAVTNNTGKKYNFLPANVALSGDHKGLKSFANKQAAEAYLSTLSLNAEQLEAIANSLTSAANKSAGGGQTGHADFQGVVLEAMAEGRLLVVESKVSLPKAPGGAPLEAATDMAGAKPVELAPPSEAPAQEVAEAATEAQDAEQAEALAQASEEGTPFCEECAAEEEQQAETAEQAEPEEAETAQQNEAAANDPEPVADSGTPTPAPAQEKEPECKLLSVSAECSHGRSASTSDNYLDVVPSEMGDLISLVADVKDECGDHPEWTIKGPMGTSTEKGKEVSFKANFWKVKNPQSWYMPEEEPQKYEVTAESCSGTKRVDIYSYPNDKFAMKINGLDHNKTWKQKLDYAQNSIAEYLDKFSWSMPAGSVSASGQWTEDDKSHQAFYKYQVTGGFNPVIGANLRIPFGPTAAIPKWIKRYGDFYLFVEFTGGASLNLAFEKLRPEQHTAYLEFKGSIEGKVGASLFLANDNVLKVEAFGGTGINFKAWTDKELELKGMCQFDWEGLKGSLSVQVGWGWVEFQREWLLVDGGPLHKDPWVFDVEALFND